VRLIADHVKKYGREDDRAFSLISARIEDQGYDPDMVAYCVKKWREGHRIFVPPVKSGWYSKKSESVPSTITTI